MKYFHVYAKLGCEFCKSAMELLSEEELPFIVTMLDKCQDMEYSLKKKFMWETVPIVLEIRDETSVARIGGFTELSKYISQGKKDGSLSEYYTKEADFTEKEEDGQKDQVQLETDPEE